MGKLDKEKAKKNEKMNIDEEINNNSEIEREETQDKEEQNNIGTNELVKLKADYEELKNKLLRTQADFDNFRKRTSLEKTELAMYINGQLIKELLPACDNFERALIVSSENNNFDSLSKGIGMVYKQIRDILEAEGLAEIEVIGKQFNPEYHQAVMQVEQEGESGIVVEEIQKGYTYKGKVIRPAMVKVSI